MQLTASILVHAEPEAVRAVYADYTHWPTLFPTISAVRVRHRRAATVVLELDHVEGTVINELTVTADGDLVLHEIKRHYDAVFVNHFAPHPAGTIFTVAAQLSLKGWARLVEPVVSPYVRRLIRRLQLEPVKAWAETQTGWDATTPSEPAEH